MDQELVEAGFARLTMESVAARAKTGVAVLYRRWPNKDDLVIAAIRHYGTTHPVDIPDTGSLRGDLIALLSSFSSTRVSFAAIVSAVFSGLLWTVNSLSPTSSRTSEAAQGRVMDGPQQLVGDLYVLAGLISMAAMAVLLARTGSRRNADPEPRPAGRWRASQAIRRIAART